MYHDINFTSIPFFPIPYWIENNNNNNNNLTSTIITILEQTKKNHRDNHQKYRSQTAHQDKNKLLQTKA
jgi:hypothetical protein